MGLLDRFRARRQNGERPVRAAVVDAVRENYPLASAIAEGVWQAANLPDTNLAKADIPVVVDRVQQAIAKDPVARSVVGAEPFWENRVKIGLYMVGIGAALKLIDTDAASWWEENKETLTTIIMVFGGGVAAIGEWMAHWLAGVNWKKPWTLFGLGR